MSESTLKPEVLCQYASKAQTFIETGTASGEGVQVALDVGFKSVVTIEANHNVFAKACQRYAENSEVLCMLGDSGKVLPGYLTGLQEKAVFWLDAHYSTGEEELGPGVDKCPLLADLHAIADHAIKDHILLIDDIRYFRGGLPQWHNITLGDIIDAVMSINQGYCVRFVDGFVEKDILVAEVL